MGIEPIHDSNGNDTKKLIYFVVVNEPLINSILLDENIYFHENTSDRSILTVMTFQMLCADTVLYKLVNQWNQNNKRYSTKLLYTGGWNKF